MVLELVEQASQGLHRFGILARRPQATSARTGGSRCSAANTSSIARLETSKMSPAPSFFDLDSQDHHRRRRSFLVSESGQQFA